jgi:2-amino-4-hydroxy-6-hydroxymethyldihydropteridine diphosphokinase
MTRSAADVLLGLGGNCGDRHTHLRAGVRALAALPGCRLTAVSGIWESEFVGEGVQDDYLNACVRLRTEWTPRALLEALQAIERTAGKAPDSHMLPRTLDLDILLWDDRRVDVPGLRIPHPRLAERAFVLEPLAEIAPERRHPDSGLTVAALCDKIRAVDGPWVRPLPHLNLERDGCDA